jgi:hypothetical protein
MAEHAVDQLPPEPEQLRLLAKAIADLEAVVSILVENRGELLPGEASEELLDAWKDARPAFTTLAQKIIQAIPRATTTERPNAPVNTTLATLREHQLLGPVGVAKRSMLWRLRDVFNMYWHTLPRTDDKRTKAAAAAIDLLEGGASIAGSIPFGGAVEEALLLFKQAVTVRYRRGF